jgi:serralysin
VVYFIFAEDFPMVLVIPSADVINAGSDAYTIAAVNATFIVRRDISLVSTLSSGDGVELIAAGARVFVYGEVIGEAGIRSGQSFRLEVGESGLIAGVSGLVAPGRDITLNNFGTIAGDNEAIQCANLLLRNDGTVGGLVSVRASVTVEVQNTGTILGSILGGSADDLIENSGFILFANLNDGNDEYYGSGQTDKVADGNGEDIIDLGAGRDQMQVAADRDIDHFDGGDGIDRLDLSALPGGQVTVNVARGIAQNGNGGTNLIEGFESYFLTNNRDLFYGDNMRETVFGRSGDDLIFARSGNDRLFGGDHNDSISGEDGDDRLNGGFGNDSLSGGNGVDQIVGGAGSDIAAGGTGPDVFVFRQSDLPTIVSGAARDRITDFAIAEDRIDLSSYDTLAADELILTFRGTAGINGVGQVAVRQVSGNTFVDISFTATTAQATIQLDGLHTMTAAHFFL